MHARVVMEALLLGSSFISGLSAAQTSSNISPTKASIASAPPQESVRPSEETINRITDRTIVREKEEADTLSQYSPITETHIQQVRSDKALGIVPKSDFYFLGQADFRSRLKVDPLLENEKKGDWMWSYDPAGFLQMIFVDRVEFDKIHYTFKNVRREFLGDVRCYVFDVMRAQKIRGPRFVGRIWVEDQNMTIVRINGTYEPGESFSLKTLQDKYYLHFDSYRTNVKPGLWLPSYTFVQQLDLPMSFSGPRLKTQTYFWGYRLAHATYVYGGLKTSLIQGGQNGSRSKQREGHGAPKKLSIRLQVEPGGLVLCAASRAIEILAALNQPAAGKPSSFLLPVDAGRARSPAKQYEPNYRLAFRLQVDHRSVDRRG